MACPFLLPGAWAQAACLPWDCPASLVARGGVSPKARRAGTAVLGAGYAPLSSPDTGSSQIRQESDDSGETATITVLGLRQPAGTAQKRKQNLLILCLLFVCLFVL